MTTAKVALPPKLKPVFTGPARYRGAYGGRGSGKSFSFAKMAAVRGYAEPLRILCCREMQNSIKDSVHAELAAAIRSEWWLEQHYEIGETYIRGKNGTEFLFKGLRHNYQQVKSTSGVGICWVEEAETVSEQSWSTLIPTIRAPGSEIWLTWNPENEDSPTHKRFILDPPDNCKIVKLNHNDNPWFPPELEQERLHDLSRDPDRYMHTWEGECVTRTDAQILAGKWAIEEFEPGPSWDGPYFGLDFGFANDPTAAVKCWNHDDTLYIEHEGGRVGLELDDTATFLRERLPGIDSHVIRADCARPESISFLQRHGLPLIKPVSKWAGSVQDGITHLRAYKRIVIHPRCEETAREARLYSYKIDRLSGDIMPVVLDLNNHYMDALRYALEPMIGAGLGFYKKIVDNKQDTDLWGRRPKGGSNWKTA
jgi:phage terminase large subunit